MAFASKCASCGLSEVVFLQSGRRQPTESHSLDASVSSKASLSGNGLPLGLKSFLSKPVASRKGRVCQAASSGEEASTSQTEGTPALTKRYVRRPKVKVPEADPNLKTYAVEDDNVVVEGVARIDRGEDAVTLGRQALLVAGDTAALLLFALAGKVSHTGTADFGVLPTAAPFLVGWFASGTLLGAFGADATLSGPLKAALTTGTTWVVGIPIGIVIRGVLKGQVPPTPFIVVTLVSTFVLLVGWRTALAAAGGKREGGDRSGNPFEFLELLSSLVRRWEI